MSGRRVGWVVPTHRPSHRPVQTAGRPDPPFSKEESLTGINEAKSSEFRGADLATLRRNLSIVGTAGKL